MRTYIVLVSTADGDLHPVELCEANGAHQAIKRTRDARPSSFARDVGGFDIADDEEMPVESWHAIPARNMTTLVITTEIPAPKTTYIEGQLPTLPLREADPAEEVNAETDSKTLTEAAAGTAELAGNAA